MDYDAMVLGPADLSLGPDVVQQRIREAKFAVLAADVTDSATKDPIAKPYAIKDVNGRAVAVIGLSGAPSMNGFTVADGPETVRRILQELQGRVDAVILLSHAPPDVNQRIADEIPGITAIVEGGAASLVAPWVSKVTGTPIYHADSPSSGHAGRVMGVADLTVESGKLKQQTWRTVPLDPEIADDPAMSAWVQEVYQ
jgi:2',3'-cyclic-nucleotide 2'-phosphodiesterase (5'-nucleotidase family)